MLTRYDLIVVLGYALTEKWDLPEHVYPRLAKAAELYHDKVAKKLAVVGKWHIIYERHKKIPPHTEAEIMKQILIKEHNVPAEAILKEEKSMDTIGNAFYLKKDIIVPNQFKKILILCADFHLKRASFIFNKIFGNSYSLAYLGTETKHIADSSFIQGQNEIYEDQKRFLSFMKPGDHQLLEDRLYNDPYFNLES